MGELNHECGVAAVYHRHVENGSLSRLAPIAGDINSTSRLVPRMLLDMQNRGQLASGMTSYKEDRKAILPAITHVDGTGRMQTVFKEQSPRYYKMIEKFGQATGVPVVMNTSFNLKGEPIVNTPENAFNTFSKSEMDALVLENFIIEKN